MGGEPETVGSVSVVVPTIGRARLADLVAAVLADDATTEVVVVADRDRDAVEAVLAPIPPGGAPVRVIDGPGRGPAAARQRGVEHASGDIVVLLDDDVVPAPGLVGAHRAAHAGTSRRMVVGPMPVAAELRATSVTAHLYANDYDAEWSRHVADPAGVGRDLWGGNVSVRRADAIAVPPVDVLGDLRNREDQEWGLRLTRDGVVGAIAPAALAVHWHDATAAGLLVAAADQVRTRRLLSARYPELPAAGDPAAGLPRAARVVVDLA